MFVIIQTTLRVVKNVINSLLDTICGFIFWLWFFIIMYEITGRVTRYFNGLNKPVTPCYCRCVKKEPIDKKKNNDTAPIENGSDIVEEVKPPPKQIPVVDMVFEE
jgi:hypothetical protein